MRKTPIVLSFCLFGAAASAAPFEQLLYSFQDGTTGEAPVGGLIRDRHGNLFGTTFGGGPEEAGTVFELTPPAAGSTAWTFTTIYALRQRTDGEGPVAELLAGPEGKLYGTTTNGWGFGTVFELTPPAPGQAMWTESVVHAFQGFRTDGAYSYSGLIADSGGNLYGTTAGGGAFNDGIVFELSPPKPGTFGGWTEKILHTFSDKTGGNTPAGTLLADGNGNLFGTTTSGGAFASGTVFELTPPVSGHGAWKQQVIYAFRGTTNGRRDGASPQSRLVRDADGSLYGTTVTGGRAGCIVDAPSDQGCGTVFKLTPPAAGQRGWRETVIHVFAGQKGYGGLGGIGPQSGLLLGPGGVLYGTAVRGGVGTTCSYYGNPQGCGVVFKLTPPTAPAKAWRETVLHSFVNAPGDGINPRGNLVKGPGGALYGVTFLGGNGPASCSSYGEAHFNLPCGTVFQVGR